MRVSLAVTAGPNEGLAVDFDRHDRFVVGRSARTSVRFPNKDPYLSRYHFILEINPPLCRVTDLGSRNGTFVNEQRVDRADLRDGDVVRAGHTRFRVAVAQDDTDPPAGSVETLATGTIVQSGPGVWAAGGTPGYKIVREVGRGGMGIVYEAVREADGLTVALKTFGPQTPPTRKQVDRFRREADILRQIDHPNVVRYLDSGEGDGTIWVALEFVKGTDAGHRIDRKGPMPVAAAVRVALNVLTGLAHAHGLGFVHRDVKPSNVMLADLGGRKRGVKLTDFGLARVYEDSRLSGLTLTGDMGGTPAFMPPEQILDFRNVGPPADVYGTAATLYYLLCGKFVFDFTADQVEAFGMILEGEPVPLRDRRPEVPEGLAAVVHQCLAKDPAERLPSAAATAGELLAFAGPERSGPG
jgi:serine/threonine-protein kinase